MWLLSWVPDSFLEHLVNVILITGAIATFLSFFVINRLLRKFPVIGRWVNLVQLVSAVTFIAGVYFKGAYQTEAEWRHKVEEAQSQVAKAEQEAKKANDALAKKSKEKVKVIQGKQIIVKQYIDREVTKYDTTCPVPAPVVKALNAAAKNEVPK